jgi:hypothetical protein
MRKGRRAGIQWGKEGTEIQVKRGRGRKTGRKRKEQEYR